MALMITMMMWPAGFLLLLVASADAKSVDGKKKNEHILDRDLLMSLDAQQTLLDEMGVSGLEKIREAVPLYREDLPDDYIAYWQVEYDNQYITVSSGKDTGDYEILSSGGIPSPASLLREKAAARGRKCFRFYVLTSGGEMMCAEEGGKIVATTLPEDAIFQNVTSEHIDVDMIHNYIKSKTTEQALMWREHARRVSKHQTDDEQEDEQLYLIRERLGALADNTTSSMLDLFASTGDEKYQATMITPGSPIPVVSWKSELLREVRIRYIPTGPDASSRIPDPNTHTKLCQVIKGCASANQNYAIMSRDVVDRKTGQISLELDKSTKKAFKGEEFVFAVELVPNSGATTTRYFAVEYRSSREKRATYSSWSTWSIAYEHHFPDYNQFTSGGCAVGCGPVAWSMVFGYYDRRSHLGYFTGSEALYRSGSDGTTGSNSEVAPLRNDNRMRGYIKKMNQILGTFCVFGQGASLHGVMDRVEGFYKQRQASGSPRVEEKSHWLSWAAIYSDAVESWVKSKVKQGWPVIVGWRAGSYLKWHYPVATQVRSRTKTYKSCFLWFCRTKRSTENQMYLRMGWGGSSNGWKNLEAYYAITAVY